MRRPKKIRRVWRVIFFGLLGLFFLGFAFVYLIIRDLPDPALLTNRQVSQSTKIYDRTSEVLLYEIHGEEKRTAVAFQEIPLWVKQATVAVEDEGFYAHPAFDWRGILRAFSINLIRGRVSQGGSTITQQLAKKAFLSDERTYTRKIRELVLAVQLEKRYTKDEILGLYLNQIPYGGNAYGIEAAAQTFFEKSATELNLAEAALLASLPQAPSYYSPWGNHAEELLARKDFILDKMRQLDYIDAEEQGRAKNQKLVFAKQSVGIKAPHFVIAVQDYLNRRYGEDFVRTAGLRVITSLDWNFQQIAEAVVKTGADRNTELYEGRNAALVAVDPQTGQVLALVGSRDYFDVENEGNFNVATQGLRQPGSALKPFAYLTAFKKGLTPDTVLFDVPTEFAANNPNCPVIVDFTKPEEKECYHPENFDEQFRGPVTLREALAQSINVPAIKTLYIAGIDELLKVLKTFGIKTLTERSRYGLSLVLGGGEVTLAELTGSYGVLANDGVRLPQTMVLEVIKRNSDGKEKILERWSEKPERIASEQSVRLVNDILSDPENRAPLFVSSLNLTVFPGFEVALKTGTTNDYRDAWTIGYTPSLVAGVWAGNNDNTPMKRRGGSILAAVPIWSDFMRAVLASTTTSFFPRPEPDFSDKPMLNGQFFVNNEIHSLLYYVDKSDPAGPLPSNPSKDPQFLNWEESVKVWTQNNAGLLAGLIQNKITGPDINLVIENPQSGEFIRDSSLIVGFRANSRNAILRADVFLNGTLIDTQLFQNQASISYLKQFTIQAAALQNVLKINVRDSAGGIESKEVVLFK